MKDYLISMFIDDELDIDEKIDFVESVSGDKEFKDEAVDLLNMEKLLQVDMVTAMPKIQIPIADTGTAKSVFFKNFFPPLAGFATAMTLVAAILLLRPDPTLSSEEQHRFVIYRPGSSQAEIIGSFTGWTPVAMEKVGTSGYWSLTLKLPEGEHRYSYLVDNGLQIADPTVLAREQDDFGGENSIIRVNVTI
jgi:hypothetical protein